MTRTAHNSRPRRESLRKRLGAKVTARIDARDGGRCVYCGDDAERSGHALHLDHLDCASHGGADEPTNLVTACKRCNCARRNLTLPQWAAYAEAHLALSIDPEAIRAHAASL